VLRGGSFTTTGADIRITSRSKMMPDFRDETIGFRCAISKNSGEERQEKQSSATENQNSRELKTRPR
jgi:hypothetical protein